MARLFDVWWYIWTPHIKVSPIHICTWQDSLMFNDTPEQHIPSINNTHTCTARLTHAGPSFMSSSSKRVCTNTMRVCANTHETTGRHEMIDTKYHKTQPYLSLIHVMIMKFTFVALFVVFSHITNNQKGGGGGFFFCTSSPFCFFLPPFFFFRPFSRELQGI